MNGTKTWMVAGAVLCALALAPHAHASSNSGPPSGNIIYQLTGQTVSGSYRSATVSFQATQASTTLLFAMRNDPYYIHLANVSLVDTSAGSVNLLTNGDFSGGSSMNYADPAGWTYQSFGGSLDSAVIARCGPTGGNCYADGTFGGYDGIAQSISTVVGNEYTLTFNYADSCLDCTSSVYQPLSTNGQSRYLGNGRDLFVYGNVQSSSSVPEPGSLGLLVAGLIGLGWTLLRRRREA